MNKSITPIALTAAFLSLGSFSTAYATGPGFYFGAEAGGSDTYHQPSDLLTVYQNSLAKESPSTGKVTGVSGSAQNRGLAGRAFFGYNLNRYIGIEAGYTQFANSRYSKVKLTTQGGAGAQPSDAHGKTTQFAADLAIKPQLPLGAGFDVYGKLGAAYEQADSSVSYFVGNKKYDDDDTTSAVVPLVGLGVEYDITPRVVVNLSWNHYFKGHHIPKADFVGLGISYHFVTEYCGQFVCNDDYF